MKTLNICFKNLQLLFSCLSIFIFLSLPNYSFAQTTLYGDSIALGDGKVRTFVHVNAFGIRDQIGVSMTAGVMNNLDTIQREFVLALPAPVAADDTTFNHVYFTWSPVGHGPPGIFQVPHFDFHFSTVSVGERQSVIPGIDPVYYPQEFVPSDYKRDNFPPGVVPNRGLHWGDSTRIITNANFTNTFIITTYRGKRFNWEPMITRAYLLTNPDTIIAIKQAQLYRRAGDYPQNYNITYDAGNQTYNVVLRDFERREGNSANPFIGISNIVINGSPVTAPVFCGSSILTGAAIDDIVDLDITGSDWDIGDSVTLTAFFDPPEPQATIIFTPSLPVNGYPARTHLHFVSNVVYHGQLRILATDETGDTTSCSLLFDVPLPVELTSFVSTIHENDVTLNWTTASEENNSRFEIERRDARGEKEDVWNRVGFVTGNGSVSTPKNYKFTDKNLSSGNYKYRLKQIDFNGNYEYHNLSHEVVIGVPTRFKLSQNYPNPFNPKTIINYTVGASELPGTNNVSIKVYEISGREVAVLVNQIQNAGYYSVDFDGNNLSSGVYFYKLAVGGNIIDTKRMVLMK
ncbi:MAG: T9SS type A sorting domain-containing protein [Ignavibacteria bacterium]